VLTALGLGCFADLCADTVLLAARGVPLCVLTAELALLSGALPALVLHALRYGRLEGGLAHLRLGSFLLVIAAAGKDGLRRLTAKLTLLSRAACALVVEAGGHFLFPLTAAKSISLKAVAGSLHGIAADLRGIADVMLSAAG